ncbi:MAG TPA: hypothetical protein VHL11_10710 [Phototrophicaceae bacterium]|nr:hypothetical protein [Phototrophicaceae bacterium]
MQVLDTKQQIDKLTGEFFNAVSFQRGQRPAYNALHTIFIASAVIIKNSGAMPEINTVSQFIKPRQQMVDSGQLTSFCETETAAITEIFGNIAHRLSTYEKVGVNASGEFTGQGVISIQFILTPDGWKMSAMAWDDERPGLTIPEKYR